MALPRSFTTSEEYFEAITLFLGDNQYLFKDANTNVLLNTVFDQISVENLYNIVDNTNEVFENNLYMKDIDEKIKKFEAEYEESLDIGNEIKFNAPLNPKKQHEIIYLAEEIKAICDSINCCTIVDFGSGLGYLDQHLFEITNYKILGLESNEYFHDRAKKRQRKYHEDSLEHVKYKNHKIFADSNEVIEQYLEEEFPDTSNFCIAGLHACADLTVDAMDLFLKMADCRAMVLMSCCYHKMEINDEYFKNFPVSQACKEVFQRNNCREFMEIPFLRLAAQPPESRSDLKSSVFNLLARAVLQLYADRHDCILKRKKRKAVRIRTLNNDFESYLQDACTNGFTISKLNGDTIFNFELEEIRNIWRELDIDTFNKAAIFVLLQNKLQPIIENLILYDRLVYLKENGVRNCKYKRIFNSTISPRCLALIVCK